MSRRADRSLLVNLEHPDPADPLRTFGVDDGEGYVAGEKRWRFIGAYLIYGQWKQAIVSGIRQLAAAYLVTGDPAYAHKAGVLLDRVADLYPTFDFGREGVMYEGPPSAGYVSTWHDACLEVFELTIAYDIVFEAISQDESLIAFLSAQAARHKLANDKSSFASIQRNIEERILRDTVANRPKIESNYPTTDITIATILAVLGWPDNREAVCAILDQIIEQATAVDGLSGEKGIAGYTAIAPHTVAELLGRYNRIDPEFLTAMLAASPAAPRDVPVSYRHVVPGRILPEHRGHGCVCAAVSVLRRSQRGARRESQPVRLHVPVGSIRGHRRQGFRTCAVRGQCTIHRGPAVRSFCRGPGRFSTACGPDHCGGRAGDPTGERE